MEGKVRGLAKEGDAVVETEQGLVFAHGGLPGERVRAVDLERDGKIIRARSLTILEASPERVEPPCPYVVQCGGCPLMHGSATAQREIKRETLTRALSRIPGATELTIDVHAPTELLAYRRRARLAWKRTGAGLSLGFRGSRRDRIVDVDRCIVLAPALDAALVLLRANVGPHLPGSGELQLALGDGGRAVVSVSTSDSPPRAFFAAIEALVADGSIAGASLRVGGTSVATRIGDPREHGADVEGRALVGPEAGFSQAHAEINAALGAAVLELAAANERKVLELHAGHGNLTLALASRAAHVRAVELAADATAALRTNLSTHGLRADVITGDASTSIPSRGYDVVVLDPPRTGAKDAMEPIAKLAPVRVVYVSCDPATLARDLEVLGARGYRLDAVRGFDMFPQTAHVEAVARMIRG